MKIEWWIEKLVWPKIMQLVPTEINGKFGHLGGVGEINTEAFEQGDFKNGN